jgi:hypothetical protein
MVMDAGLNSTGHKKRHAAAGRLGPRQARPNPCDGDPHQTAPMDMPDPDPRKLAQDWITLWQSELSAMAADPEIRESWQTFMALWAGAMTTMLRGMPREPKAARHDGSGQGPAAAADATRASAADAAPDSRDVEIERLARHVAALERRLADLTRVVETGRGGDPRVHPKIRSKPGRGRKSRD